MLDLLKGGISILSAIVEASAALVIAFAIAEALFRTLRLFGRLGRRDEDAMDAPTEIRLRLGQWLTLALEFTVAADVLRTGIAPSWEEIGKLAAIVLIRTALNYFLQREIGEMPKRTSGLTPPHAS